MSTVPHFVLITPGEAEAQMGITKDLPLNTAELKVLANGDPHIE